MPRPYPNRRRRRPGRRPPHRYSGCQGPRPGGFTGHGLGKVYDQFLPMRGKQRKSFFNGMAGLLTLVAGYVAAVLGYRWAGPLGSVFGLGAGLVVGARFLEQQRFFRR